MVAVMMTVSMPVMMTWGISPMYSDKMQMASKSNFEPFHYHPVSLHVEFVPSVAVSEGLLSSERSLEPKLVDEVSSLSMNLHDVLPR